MYFFYLLCICDRYQKHVGYGLLYYLRSNQTQVKNQSHLYVYFSVLEECLNYMNLVKGIRVQRSDLVGLIMRRNELANNILKASTAQSLPPMLQVGSS